MPLSIRTSACAVEWVWATLANAFGCHFAAALGTCQRAAAVLVSVAFAPAHVQLNGMGYF